MATGRPIAGRARELTTASSRTGRRLRAETPAGWQSRSMARNPRRSWTRALEQFVHFAQAPHQRLHEADGAFRIRLDRGDEFLIGGGKAFRVARRFDSRGSRPRLDQAHFAEHLAGLQPAHGPGVRAAPDDDVDRSADDEERRIALVALSR